jgi:hypothetical protein
MLEGLDRIDWGSLGHAYGPATDVPGQLRALASADKKTRDDALYELFGNIWHQGTVYEASSPAVPFLIELLREPSIEDKVGILNLLECLATGSSYLDVHEPGEKEDVRRGCGDPDFEEALSRELRWVEETHNAVEAGIPVYLKLLGHDDWQIRLAAAKVLETCRTNRDIAAASLRQQFEDDTDPRVHFGLLLCLGEVGQAEDIEFLRAIVGSEPDPRGLMVPGEEPTSPGFLRWAAAIALVQLQREEAPLAAVRILEETFANPDPLDEFLKEMPWAPPDAIALTSSILALIPARTAVPVLVAALGVVGKSSVPDVLWVLLRLAFPESNGDAAVEPHERRTLASLSPVQRQALEAMVARDAVWIRPVDLGHTLKRLGLPERREELRAFLQVSPA